MPAIDLEQERPVKVTIWMHPVSEALQCAEFRPEQ